MPLILPVHTRKSISLGVCPSVAGYSYAIVLISGPSKWINHDFGLWGVCLAHLSLVGLQLPWHGGQRFWILVELHLIHPVNASLVDTEHLLRNYAMIRKLNVQEFRLTLMKWSWGAMLLIRSTHTVTFPFSSFSSYHNLPFSFILSIYSKYAGII